LDPFIEGRNRVIKQNPNLLKLKRSRENNISSLALGRKKIWWRRREKRAWEVERRRREVSPKNLERERKEESEIFWSQLA
jgi:hypothetical protein